MAVVRMRKVLLESGSMSGDPSKEEKDPLTQQ